MYNIKFVNMALTAALVALLLLSGPNIAGASAYCDWESVWSTNYGDLDLVWKMGKVQGTFGATGKLEGAPADYWANVIRGTWTDGEKSGIFEFRMDRDMKGFRGWRDEKDNIWNGKRDEVPEPVD